MLAVYCCCFLMLHTRALMLPTETCGGMTCPAGWLASLMWCCMWTPMLAWGCLSPGLLAAVGSASRRTSAVICCTAPWLSLTCVSLPRLVLLTLRLSRGLLMEGRAAALIMLLSLALEAVVPGSVASTLLPPGLFAALRIPVLSLLSTLLATGITLLLPCAPHWSSGGRHAAPSGKLRALIVPLARIRSVVTSSSAPSGISRPLGPCLLTSMSGLQLVRLARPPGLPSVPLRGTPARSMLMLQLGLSSVTGGL